MHASIAVLPALAEWHAACKDDWAHVARPAPHIVCTAASDCITYACSLLDYRSSDMLLQQQLIGRPTCLALHPLGLLLAIGSAEKLAFFYILAYASLALIYMVQLTY